MHRIREGLGEQRWSTPCCGPPGILPRQSVSWGRSPCGLLPGDSAELNLSPVPPQKHGRKFAAIHVQRTAAADTLHKPHGALVPCDKTERDPTVPAPHSC